MAKIVDRLKQLSDDDRGAVISIELISVTAVALIGLVIGFASIRDAAISELSDVAGSFQDSNQSYDFRGVTGVSASTGGSSYSDQLDPNDSVDDTASGADNGIIFVIPEDESGSVSITAEGESGDVTATVGAPVAEGWLLWSVGNITLDAELEAAGNYTFSSRLWASRGGPDLANAQFLINGVPIDDFDITPTNFSGAQVYSVNASLPAGNHQFSVRFTNDYYVPPIDRNLFIDWLQVDGPN